MSSFKIVLFSIMFFSALICTSCGSKKSTSQSHTKGKTDIDLVDNSKINTKIESEKQFVDTNTKERIVTMYGVRFDTIQINGKPYIVPFSYPIQKEENRDISTQNFLYRLSIRDSIENAVNLKYKAQIDEKEKKLIELKESKIIYQISILVTVIILLVILVLYIISKVKNKYPVL